jgi:predicted ATPase with chaperone activity
MVMMAATMMMMMVVAVDSDLGMLMIDASGSGKTMDCERMD